MFRVETGNRLSLVVASWLGKAATHNWILIRGMSRAEAGNRSGFVCTIWLATAAVVCWISRLMREDNCDCNCG